MRPTSSLPLLAALALTVCMPVGGARDVARAHVGLDTLERETSAEVVRHPDSAEARLERARTHEIAREWDAALAELEAAAERGAEADVVGAARGRVFLEAGWPRMAKRELERVLARRPDAWAVLFERGRAWLQLGHAEEAARDFGRAIAGLPQPTPEQVIERRDALLSIGKKVEAVRALDEGMARVGRVVSLQLPAVDLEVELRHYDAALARLAELLARGPQNPSWVARRGEILEKAGRPAEARAEYAKALALLDQRPAGRRGKPFDDLRQRLETALAPAVAQQRGERE